MLQIALLEADVELAHLRYSKAKELSEEIVGTSVGKCFLYQHISTHYWEKVILIFSPFHSLQVKMRDFAAQLEESPGLERVDDFIRL